MTVRRKDHNPIIKMGTKTSEIFGDLSELDYKELKRDFEEHGVRVTIVLAQDGTLIDGNYRLQSLLPPYRAQDRTSRLPRAQIGGLIEDWLNIGSINDEEAWPLIVIAATGMRQKEEEG